MELKDIKITTNVHAFLKFNNIINLVDECVTTIYALNQLKSSNKHSYRINEWILFSNGTDIYKVLVKDVKKYINENIFRLED